MEQVKEVTALALPDEQKFSRDIEAINRFQRIVHAQMVEGQDYGVIPGTSKPTLLKPGAEKITKLLGLSDRYEIIDRQEDWQRPFFRYLVKCQLVHVSSGVVISEGLGECNSMESKYRWRWVFYNDLPEHLKGDNAKEERHRLAMKSVTTKRGKTTMYRIENEDVYSQVNTMLKMAKKRALVDAALSAGRLSNVFTQDVEDTEDIPPEAEAEPVPEEVADVAQDAEQKAPEAEQPEAKQSQSGHIDWPWLRDQILYLQGKKLKAWSNTNILSYLKTAYGARGATVYDAVQQLTKEQAADFVKKVQEAVEMA
jgi:hypothetical protein